MATIARVLIEHGIPVAKLRKIKDLIKVLGGPKEAAKMLRKAKNWRMLLQIGGSKLEALAKELLGYNDIAQACFIF